MKRTVPEMAAALGLAGLRVRVHSSRYGLQRDPGFVCFRNPAGAGLRSRKGGFMQHDATVIATGRVRSP
jgi:hypothetical protein